MKYTEYKFEFTQTPIVLTSETYLDEDMCELVTNFIDRYKKEVSNLYSSSLSRFNSAPLNFPIYVDDVFLEFIENYVTFVADIKNRIVVDYVNRILIKTQNFILDSREIFVSSLMLSIYFLVSKLSPRNVLSYKNFKLENGKLGFLEYSVDFNARKNFTQKQQSLETYSVKLTSANICKLEYFFKQNFKDVVELTQKAKDLNIMCTVKLHK